VSPNIYARFIKFLKEELLLPNDCLVTLERSCLQDPGPIPMILWKYGLVTLQELDRIYDWLEHVSWSKMRDE
jgi:Protein of unknown function (DUF2949)